MENGVSETVRWRDRLFLATEDTENTERFFYKEKKRLNGEWRMNEG